MTAEQKSLNINWKIDALMYAMPGSGSVKITTIMKIAAQ